MSSPIIERLQEIAERNPSHHAIVGREGSLTYAELLEHVSWISANLRLAGVRPGDVVAILAPSTPAVVCLLPGILAAGATYLPLDLRLPVVRRNAILSASACSHLVTHGTTDVGQIPSTIRVHRAEDLCNKVALPSTDSSTGMKSAYLMYTSGTTGTPKGVLIPQSAILNLVTHDEIVCWGPSTRVLHAAPLSFDASTFEIWGPLLNGATCVVYESSIVDGASLQATIREFNVNTAWLTAALFNTLLDSDPQSLGGLDDLLIGGEALSADHVRRFFATHPDCRLINGYGPTECTTFAATYSIPRDLPSEWSTIPIGQPFRGVTIEIMSPDQEPLGAGSEGEVYIGGAGLAEGYLGDEPLTTSKFIHVRNHAGESVRMYRTGDRGRVNAAGNIECLGRLDSQVKLRGFRIELSDIEATLRSLPGIRNACCVLHKDRVSVEPRLIGYLVLDDGLLASEVAIQAELSKRLPDYMIPARLVFLDALPVTRNGKLDRSSLPPAPGKRPESRTQYVPPQSDAEHAICEAFREVLGVDPIGRNDSFFELGGSSLAAISLAKRIDTRLGVNLPVAELFGSPTPSALAEMLSGKTRATGRQDSASGPKGDRESPIAIVGFSGRFPGADDVEAFWKALCEGRENITRFELDQLDPAARQIAEREPAYVRARGVLSRVDEFDHKFFGISAAEAQMMDPQQRVFLELALEALEIAGHDQGRFSGDIGVFAGMHNATYFQQVLWSRPDLRQNLGEFAVMLQNEKDYLATRVAHRLDLRGPAISVNTACSTSLVAIVQACSSLRLGHCDMALAGGVSINCPPNTGYSYQEGGMLSPDGRTRPFDVAAAGTVFSDGAGIVVLKRLPDAIRDRNTVYAVIKGEAINNDGGAKASFTAPNPTSQSIVVKHALTRSGVSAADIGYVEAHGTATPIGDPIEVMALTNAYREQTDSKEYCGIGSLKGNFGHMVTAAGVASVIKVALSLQREYLPPSINFTAPNPALALETSPFKVVATGSPWPHSGSLRRAGVSSFGVGGTNAHIVMEEAPCAPAHTATTGTHIFPVSAKSPAALSVALTRLAEALSQSPRQELVDIAFTLQEGRAGYPYRAVVVARDRAEMATALVREATQTGVRCALPATRFAIALAGQGSQFLGMGKELYETCAEFRAAVNDALQICDRHGAPEIRDAVLGAKPVAVRDTRVAQASIFTVQYGVVSALETRGLRAGAFIGHSVGEFAAATMAGVMDLETAVRLVLRRGELMQAQPSGGMLGVKGTAQALASGGLPPGLTISALNGPSSTVVAGNRNDLEAFKETLEARGIASRMLDVSHAFHSPQMEVAARDFQEFVAHFPLKAPSRDIISTATGRLLAVSEATDPRYWATQIQLPVRFADAVSTALDSRYQVLLEAGPSGGLAGLVRSIAVERGAEVRCIDGFRAGESGQSMFLDELAGGLWKAGYEIDWAAIRRSADGRRVALPTYPFERESSWVDAASNSEETKGSRTSASRASSEPSRQPATKPAAGATVLSIEAELRALLEQITGEAMDNVPSTTTFNQLGLDSLILTQVAMKVQRQWGIKIGFRELTESVSSIAALDVFVARAKAVESSSSHRPNALAESPQRINDNSPRAEQAAEHGVGPKYDVKTAFGAIARIHSNAIAVTPSQKERLRRFMRDYIGRTTKSKDFTAHYRRRMADPRVVNGFRPALKEITYQIVIKESKGSVVIDLDGNRYIDVLNGFGMNLFGWQPDFINEAVARQLKTGYEIGPQHPLAGDVAERICQMTGAERVGLCNTGSEAVMGAIRIARTVTGRGKIALFTGSYHGIFDEVIVRATRGNRAYPAAPGIMPNTADNVIVLDYGNPDSLDVIRANASDLAAVLVEPVQSRRPDLQPREYLKSLRALASETGTVLIFDEVVTGFRSHPGGAQAIFDVRADLVTYGKVVGGGFPVGVIAGQSEFMDALDGGGWEFGDESRPTAGVTYFAGTFVRHPIALSASQAVLKHLEAQGPTLQATLNARTTRFAERLNAVFQKATVPVLVKHFSSVWRFSFTEEHALGDVFFAMLRHRGIHILDNFPCFMTTAHSDQDLDAIVAAVQDAVDVMVACEFLPGGRSRAFATSTTPPVPGAVLGRMPNGDPAWFVPNPTGGGYVRVG